MHIPWPFGSAKASSDVPNQVSVMNDGATAPSGSISNAPRALTREEQADHEFAELVKSFQAGTAEAENSINTSSRTSKKTSEPPKPRPVYEAQVFEDGTIDIRPEIMHPRSMNCRQAFDQAFYCQSLGGKFNDIYRHGHFQSCSEQWGAFFFCMRTRTLDADAKAAQTTEYYADRDERRKKEHGSSEDVWEIRTRSVQKAFWKDPDQAGKADSVPE